MKPRQLYVLLNMPKDERADFLAEGMELLARHVEQLHDDLTHLIQADRPRAASVIDSLASEEAAKMLIILDMARTGWSDDALVKQQVGHFYSHLARGIYARVVHGRPAHYAEVQRFVDGLLQSLYLDGPNEVDWIFRNEVEAHREDGLYVDYVTSEGTGAWLTPLTADRDVPFFEWVGPSLIIELALATARAGFTQARALRLLGDAWAGVRIDSSTRWEVVRAINAALVDELESLGLQHQDMSEADLRLLHQQWTFPLSRIDMRRATEVSGAQLQAQRSQWLAMQ